MNQEIIRDSFTLPGEEGYEKLTLDMAKKWGADVIRDSDGTKLSDEIINSGYGIYSTICLIRSDNQWAKENTDKLQQNFLMSFPVMAEDDSLEIEPLKGYFRDQFRLNKKDDPKEFWQVFDRTSGKEVPKEKWTFNEEKETVFITGITPWHKYTVNFLAVRLWEEISMYNHITNDWGDKERLMAVEPRYPETRANILKWLENWCLEHESTTVVRFTSMFYNFAWFWGSDAKNRYLFSDWGSYDFTVNPVALREFEKTYGYKMTSEDFVNQGKYNATHNPPSKKYRDWMEFVNSFVIELGKECIDMVHKYGKKAYVFYDDSWIGVEPYGKRFPEFGFDGIIKCVFNGFEARLGGGVQGVDVRELRLHPYLFPTGLTGEPTFAPGGNPTLDASRFWVNVRRALLRVPVDRIGLGGYLHLVEPFPDFCDYIEKISDEFRLLKSFHEGKGPRSMSGKVGILTAWGSLRSWICSGHLHEHPEVDLTNVLEALSGLPFEVEFLSFDDIRENGVPEDIRVIINAGCAESAWNGKDEWKDEKVVEILTKWVAGGNGFIGINEPTAVDHSSQFFQMSHILGVDKDLGNKKCMGRYQFDVEESHFVTEDTPEPQIPACGDIFVLDGNTRVLAAEKGAPTLTSRTFGTGRGVYMSGFRFSIENTRLLTRAICHAGNMEEEMGSVTGDNMYTEVAYYEGKGKVVIINNSGEQQSVNIQMKDGSKLQVHVEPYDIEIKEMQQ